MIDFRKEFGDDLANFVDKYFRLNPNYQTKWPPFTFDKKNKKKVIKMYKSFLQEYKDKDPYFSKLYKNHINIAEDMMDSFEVYNEICLKKLIAGEYLKNPTGQVDIDQAERGYHRFSNLVNEGNKKLFSELYGSHMYNILCPETEYLEAIAFCMLDEFMSDDFNWMVCGSGAGKFPLSILQRTKKSKVAAIDRADNRSRIFNNYFSFYHHSDKALSQRLTNVKNDFMDPEEIEPLINFSPNIVLYMFSTLYSLDDLITNALIYADDHAFLINNIVSKDLRSKEAETLRIDNPPKSAVIDFFVETDNPYQNYVKNFFNGIWKSKQLNTVDGLYDIVKMCEYEPFKFVSIEEIRLS